MQGDSAGVTAHHLPGSLGQDDSGEGDAAILPASWPRRCAGTFLGCVTALLGFLYFLVVGTVLGPFLLWPPTRTSALSIVVTGARRLTTLERSRRAVFFGDRFPEHYKASDQKILRYLAIRSYSGLLCGVVIALLGFGIALAGLLVRGMAQGTLHWDELLMQVLLGSVLLFLDVQGLHSLAALDARIARECFGPSERERLRQRIHELATSRAAVVQAVDAERRRIERDLHDGIQQRLVALGMLLGRARRGRDPEQADTLLGQAHQESQNILAELREVTWRVYPSALDSLGLKEALGGVSERCSIPVRTEFDVTEELPQPVETAAYFVVSESVTNAAKHSRATAVSVRVLLRGRVLTVQIQDNGAGDADPTGSGLSGLRSRVAALDGVLRVDSPEGGPTTITAELPCA
ncbi:MULTISPECIES: sensor histidine kinase [Streptomyces]|uniref:sensor histidine kinase n=1 Tax=Streptomyces TaxID=1883 RepID=UPI00287F4D74|nr:sensor histidine kinase [Streptomyces sp. CGMCC 4.1456]WNF63896.1 sensor histidine kinase [Streptomyces sp. CGMCC 4.1456]